MAPPPRRRRPRRWPAGTWSPGPWPGPPRGRRRGTSSDGGGVGVGGGRWGLGGWGVGVGACLKGNKRPAPFRGSPSLRHPYFRKRTETKKTRNNAEQGRNRTGQGQNQNRHKRTEQDRACVKIGKPSKMVGVPFCLPVLKPAQNGCPCGRIAFEPFLVGAHFGDLTQGEINELEVFHLFCGHFGRFKVAKKEKTTPLGPWLYGSGGMGLVSLGQLHPAFPGDPRSSRPRIRVSLLVVWMGDL